MASFGRVKKSSIFNPIVFPTQAFSTGGNIVLGNTNPTVETKQTEYLDPPERRLFYKTCIHPVDDYIKNEVTVYGSLIGNNGHLVGAGEIRHELRDLAIALKNPTVWIAGGAVASSLLGEYGKAKDIDIFCGSYNSFLGTLTKLESMNFIVDPEHIKECKADPSRIKFIEAKPGPKCTQTKTVQVIKMVWYESVYDVLESFDMLHVKSAIWANTDDSKIQCAYHKDGLDLLRKRQIVISNTIFPVSMMRRIKKYVDRGFTMADGDIVDAVAELGHECDDTHVPLEIISSTVSLDENNRWSNPEYKKDYYELEPYQFKHKWG